ncbi:hypothetical protein Pint_01715 [Pistacia integerrima]|uniref:Uncharacterized protein n=1 Tax=Pistacia integerrima TaxID=434235 RepID=A0ACC0ZHY9_9ROSI|nr:hypothetical protein Pint_01715 [Pistacia integerrima]
MLIDLFLLPLEGYDIVLGTQWLRTLGVINWDFTQLRMNLQLQAKRVTLQGSSKPSNRFVSMACLEKITNKKPG